jgi:hypothetical protein
MLGVRRMNQRELPDLIIKKIKVQGTTSFKEEEKIEKVANWPEKYSPKIFILKKEEEFPKLKWKDVEK